MISAVLIDDEKLNRIALKTLLLKSDTSVEVIGEADNAEEAYMLINKLQPQLVFLDIKMPQKNGIELLKQFNEINFEVIFVTAYNEYAINAFELNAIGYILKPIDASLLLKTVQKAEMFINSKKDKEYISHFLQTVNPQTNDISVNKISIHHNNKVIFIGFEDILFIKTQGGICEICTTDNKKYTTSKDLKMYENVFLNAVFLQRINRNVIININHLQNYKKGDQIDMELTHGYTFEVSRRKKVEILGKLKT